MCTYVGNFHLIQLERHTQRHGFHDQRSLHVSINDLKWSGGTIDFWRKIQKKAIPFFSSFFAGMCWPHLCNVDHLLIFLR
jgi:hypothetical protein